MAFFGSASQVTLKGLPACTGKGDCAKGALILAGTILKISASPEIGHGGKERSDRVKGTLCTTIRQDKLRNALCLRTDNDRESYEVNEQGKMGQAFSVNDRPLSARRSKHIGNWMKGGTAHQRSSSPICMIGLVGWAIRVF